MQGKGRHVGLGGKISSNPCRAGCFASVYLEETVEFSQSIWKKELHSAGLFGRNGWIQPVYLEEMVEFNRFFQIGRDKTASAIRNWANFAPQADATTFTLPFVSVSFVYAWVGLSM